MTSVNPYLNFPGTTEEAFQFYRSVFGGEFTALQRFRDTPEAQKLPAADQEKIMHIALPIGDGVVLMATDGLESMGRAPVTGNNVSLSIEAESADEADRLFKGLSEGGAIEMPMQETFWGAYFGMVADKFGLRWMVNYSRAQPPYGGAR